MDKNVGLVLDGLARSGLADNTIVVYLGDHGYCLGHHGRFEKHCSYEEAAWAPLLVAYPGRVPPGRSTEALVEFIDVVPTLLDFCAWPSPARCKGRASPVCSTAARRSTASKSSSNTRRTTRL